ncbi:hypothetical protein PFISCL1PPCAC_17500, partial [Pristionchus fissidentatus]
LLIGKHKERKGSDGHNKGSGSIAGIDHSPEQADSTKELDLEFSQRVDLLFESLLPGVQLDQLDAVEDL